MNIPGNYRPWFRVIVIAIACLALGHAGDLRGEAEKDATAGKLAKELAAKLDELGTATARLEKAEDEAEVDSAARQAQALVDWLAGHAKKIEKHVSARGEKEMAQAAADLGRAAGEAEAFIDSFFKEMASRPKVVASLKKVRESGDKVRSLIGNIH